MGYTSLLYTSCNADVVTHLALKLDRLCLLVDGLAVCRRARHAKSDQSIFLHHEMKKGDLLSLVHCIMSLISLHGMDTLLPFLNPYSHSLVQTLGVIDIYRMFESVELIVMGL